VLNRLGIGELHLDRPRTRVLARFQSYVALTKPRIVELLLVTTIPTMFVAARHVPSLRLIVMTVVGGALAAGGANALNMVYDRDIDALMERTRNRPLVTGEITPLAATLFAVTLELGAFALLWSTVTPIARLNAGYAAVAFVAGGAFVAYALALRRDPSPRRAMRLFAFSIPYLTALFVAMGVDAIIRVH